MSSIEDDISGALLAQGKILTDQEKRWFNI